MLFFAVPSRSMDAPELDARIDGQELIVATLAAVLPTGVSRAEVIDDLQYLEEAARSRQYPEPTLQEIRTVREMLLAGHLAVLSGA
jgi:hypothetical protein